MPFVSIVRRDQEPGLTETFAPVGAHTNTLSSTTQVAIAGTDTAPTFSSTVNVVPNPTNPDSLTQAQLDASISSHFKDASSWTVRLANAPFGSLAISSLVWIVSFAAGHVHHCLHRRVPNGSRPQLLLYRTVKHAAGGPMRVTSCGCSKHQSCKLLHPSRVAPWAHSRRRAATPSCRNRSNRF